MWKKIFAGLDHYTDWTFTENFLYIFPLFFPTSFGYDPWFVAVFQPEHLTNIYCFPPDENFRIIFVF